MQENFGDGDIAAHDDADPSNSPLVTLLSKDLAIGRIILLFARVF